MLSILIADSHDLIRRGLRALLETRTGWEIRGEARDGREAVRQCKEIQPNIAVLEVNMSGLNGLDAAAEIRAVSPKTRVLILTAEASDDEVQSMLRCGVRGYVHKSQPDLKLLKAIERLANNEVAFPTWVGDLMLEVRRSKNFTRLTPREREFLSHLCYGRSCKEAGMLLGITKKTAEAHRANVMRKVGVQSTVGLVRYAIRNKIIEG